MIPGREKKKKLAALNASAEESQGPESPIIHTGNKADLFNYTQYVTARVSHRFDATGGISFYLILTSHTLMPTSLSQPRRPCYFSTFHFFKTSPGLAPTLPPTSNKCLSELTIDTSNGRPRSGATEKGFYSTLQLQARLFFPGVT